MTVKPFYHRTLLTTFVLICVYLLIISCHPVKVQLIDLSIQPIEVELFGNDLVSTSLYERDIAITPNGDEIIFTVGDQKQSRRCLVSIKLIGETWTEPEILNISGKYQDIEPFFAKDGERLFFASNRPLDESEKSKDYDIWYADRSPQGWLQPIRLSDNVNTPQDEFYPSVSASGNLYFTATREDGIGREDLFVSHLDDGEYKDPEVLDTMINTSFYEFNAFIHPNEDLIIFSSFGRPDDMGGGDLYFSIKDDKGNWLPSKNMGSKINSPSLDFCPFVDVVRDNFYFTSERRPIGNKRLNSYGDLQDQSRRALNGFGNIYRCNYNLLEISD